jgi:hypothetical protein
MVPEIAYQYARERFRQMLLGGVELIEALQWRNLFLSRFHDAARAADAPATLPSRLDALLPLYQLADGIDAAPVSSRRFLGRTDTGASDCLASSQSDKTIGVE